VSEYQYVVFQAVDGPLAFGVDLDLVADLGGLLARDVPLALGFAMLSVIIRP
jgi:hypothetical protein